MGSARSFEQLESEQQDRWRRDRRLRDQVPLRERWRGCLGLAVLLSNVEATCYHGDRCLIPNESLRWMALRDVPPGCWYFHGQRLREVNHASLATATLRSGVPIIDFTQEVRESWDFARFPFSTPVRRTSLAKRAVELAEARGDTLNSRHFSREFQVLNQISEQMTRFAFCAVGRHGRPFRRSWQEHRPTGWKAYRPPAPDVGFPVPYLAFPRVMADRLFWLATESKPTGSTFTCPQCRRNVHSAAFGRPDSGTQFFEDGDFVARCPHCGRRRKWHMDDAVAAKVKRRFGRPFQEQLCAAVARGLPLASLGTSVYGGLAQDVGADDGVVSSVDRGLAADVLPHQLVFAGGRRVVLLPSTARIQVGIGRELAPGQHWCFAVSLPSQGWGRASVRERWRRLAEVLGGAPWVGALQQAWFEQELVILSEHPQLVFCRWDLAATACREVEPLGLWWDIQPLHRFLDGVLEAAGLPIFPLSRWDQLRFSVADVIVDARITDPRARSRPRRYAVANVRPSRTRAA